MLATVGLPVVPGTVPGSGVLWDGLNGIGLAVFALMVYICWLAPSTRAGYSVHALRLHIGLSVVALCVVALHAVGLLFANDVAIEYLQWRAPLYMHAGNAAFLLLVVLCTLSLRAVRQRLHRNFHQFRAAHRVLALAVLALGGWHIFGSGYLTGAGHGAATLAIDDRANAFLDRRHWPDWWRIGLCVVLLGVTTTAWWQLPDRVRWPEPVPREHGTSWLTAGAAATIALGAAYTGFLNVQ